MATPGTEWIGGLEYQDIFRLTSLEADGCRPPALAQQVVVMTRLAIQRDYRLTRPYFSYRTT
ncbi:MAG TPA: hypothetical protein PK176_02110 [Acidobacteriota bacterium]|nr:hypothetical protein [Acidobacteriota bacterium]HQM62080.1 hypothetical protein [Acidobacteriota bacterium]